MRKVERSLLALALLAAAATGVARAGAAASKLSPAATALAGYLRIETANPPGNERAGADFLAARLRAGGIEPQLLVSPRGRVSLVARLPATTGADSPDAPRDPAAGAILLLHHIDTVPAGENWKHPPYAGEVHDGAIWGRGAIDAKGLGIAHLLAFLDLARSAQVRQRDVVFLATADEEAGGGEGVSWLLDAHPELFANIAAVLNEGGANKAVAGRTLYWGVEVDQKRPLWLEVSATGRPGHASAANPESATHRLVAGLQRLVAASRPWRVTPAAEAFIGALARFDPQARGAAAELATLRAGAGVGAPADSASRDSRPRSLAGFESLLTDTLQITTLAGSERINVVAGEARAGIDVRLLPDTNERSFVAEVERLLGPELTVRVLLASPAAPPSSTSSAAYRTLAAVLGRGSPVVPTFIPAFTDSRSFRARGIAAYGFSPFALDGLELRTVHAPDERLPLAALDSGVATMIRVVRALVLAETAAP